MRRNLDDVTGEWVTHWCVSAFSDIRRAWVRGTAFTINSSTLLVVSFDEWRISTLEKC